MVERNTILPLEILEATVSKQGSQIIGPLSVTIGLSGCTIVIGPNGSGKTTLLRLMHGLEKARKGTVRWSGSAGNIYDRQSFVFQSPIIMRRSVLRNVSYPLEVRGWHTKDALVEAERWLLEVGLEAAAGKDARILSGGEKQKMALARALITKPDVLFLDEPSANLDGASTRDIERLVVLAQENGARIVMATHDFGQARRLADDILFLHHGKILEHGCANRFFEQPETLEAQGFLRGDILL